MKSSVNDGVALPAFGVLAGLAVSVVIGWLVYSGAARINLKSFFNATGLLLIIVAAGIVSYGIGDLQEASLLPGWGVPAYDFTHLVDGSVFPWLTTNSWWWVLLEAMFNLNAAPTHLQLAGWILYLVIVFPLFARTAGWIGKGKHKSSSVKKPSEASVEAPDVVVAEAAADEFLSESEAQENSEKLKASD